MDDTTINILIGMLGIILVILVPLAGFFYRNRKFKKYYGVIWKKSSSLKPSDVLGLRGEPEHGFHRYHYHRKEDYLVKEKIEANKNVLIIGNPLAGKSRAIYQGLITLNKPCDVIIPRLVDINLGDFRVPFRFCFWRKCVLVLDDLDKFVEKQNFMHLLQEFLNRKAVIIACCRSGPEYDIVCNKMEKDFSSIFGDPVEISEISREEGEKVAKQTGRSLPPTFDGNIGSIFVQLSTMRDRFRGCSDVERGILKSIRRLYYAGVYREREIFSIERIKQVCKKKEEIEKKQYEWVELLKGLKNKGFVKIIGNEACAEETYLEFVIEDGLSVLDNLNEMMRIFSNDFEALFNIGTQACEIGTIDIQKARYMKVAIEAYREALKVYTFERFPMDYAMTQNNLGTAYRTLGEVEAKAENCRKAMEAYKESLKVFTKENFPENYKLLEHNLRILIDFCKGKTVKSPNSI